MRWATFLVLIVLVFPVSPGYAATQMEDLENALMCKCDDKCGKVLINCTCDTAKKTRKILAAKLESGLTVNQIVKQYVDKYGETVLSAPTKSGFNISAWVTPFAALVVGGVGIRQLIRTWLGKNKTADDSETEESPTNKETPPINSRLQNELDRLET